VTRQALEDLLPSAKAHDVGVVAMKPFSAKTSKLVTCFYNPSLSLLSDEPELKALLGNDIDSMASSALRYTLAQEISVVIPGVKSVHEVQVAAEAGNHYAELTSEEQNRFQVQLDGKLYCRDCGMCLPCPVGIDISAVLRFHSFAEIYDLKQWAKKLYNGLDINASKCTCCGICEPKCPYYLPIIKLLKEVDKTFK
jgi:predicted aldo/keto reductase-like oxidoreductase